MKKQTIRACMLASRAFNQCFYSTNTCKNHAEINEGAAEKTMENELEFKKQFEPQCKLANNKDLLRYIHEIATSNT